MKRPTLNQAVIAAYSLGSTCGELAADIATMRTLERCGIDDGDTYRADALLHVAYLKNELARIEAALTPQPAPANVEHALQVAA